MRNLKEIKDQITKRIATSSNINAGLSNSNKLKFSYLFIQITIPVTIISNVKSLTASNISENEENVNNLDF